MTTDAETAIEPDSVLDPGRRPLTGKRRAFVDAYLGPAAFNGTEAARIAGYSDVSTHSLEVEGSRLLRDAEVDRTIKRALDAREIDTDYVLSGLKETVEAAQRDKAYGAAIAGYTQLGRALGLYVDRVELDLQAATAKLAAELGIDPAELEAETRRIGDL